MCFFFSPYIAKRLLFALFSVFSFSVTNEQTFICVTDFSHKTGLPGLLFGAGRAGKEGTYCYF